MPTAEFEARMQKAVDDGVVPGVVLLAKFRDGSLDYSLSLGNSVLPPASNSPIPMTLDTTFTLASMTKLLTGVAILQLVEKKLVALDTDISSLLPELASQPVLTGFDESGSPILTRRKNPILLRHLLSHSSGAGYVFLDARLEKYFKATNQTIPMPLSSIGGKSVSERFGYPLLFEPGEGWSYGGGLDWAGELVRRLSGGKGLDEFVRENILSKVGVEEDRITFFPARFEQESKIKRAGMGSRNKESGRVEGFEGWGASKEETDEMGGEGAHADLTGYMTVLESLLQDDGRLLKSETLELLFEGLLDDRDPKAKEALKESVKNPGWIVGWVPDNGGEYDWSVGGLVTTKDGEVRKKGYLQWGGVFNLSWFIDRTAGVAGIFGTQVLQPADPLVRPLMRDFEEELYKLVRR